MGKILVSGAFGYSENSLDGQTVKTRDVYRLFKEQHSEDVDFFDTSDLKKEKIYILKMIWKIVNCKKLVYLPAQNNIKYFFPVIYILSVIFRFKIHYFVVGGWLREFVTHLPIHRWMLGRIAGIHVETNRLLNELKEYYKYENVDLFPNFRFFEFDPERFESERLRIVFMDCVIKENGLDWIFYLADYMEQNGLGDKISISIFGPLVEDTRIVLENEIGKYAFVKYKGVLEPSEVHKTLCQYDVLLMPTCSFAEGVPGSVVDAYFSGIPVIVKEWKHAHEYVDNGESGFIIPYENGPDSMVEIVLCLYGDRSLLHKLQANALRKRMDFASPSIDRFLTIGRERLNLCFVSRVQRTKGLDTLAKMSDILYKKKLYNLLKIDFYGQKTDDYFDTHLKSISMYEYKGVLQPNEVISTLQKYDALIFPTHYDGEGCPGILVEALSSALPIIASDWKYNSEFVKDGVNGFLCDTFDVNAYIMAIISISDPVLRNQMKKHSYMMSEKFSVSTAREKIDCYL